MRLGGKIFEKTTDPSVWIAAVQKLKCRAAYCPVEPSADDATIRAYADAAKKADIVIAEVGAWSNPISSDEKARKDNIDKCARCLTLAEKIGASCCVNVTGSRGAQWNGPDPRNFSSETLDMVVQSVRTIIDAVKPTKTSYTLEMHNWMFPETAEQYLA